jgi:hypothetical protein
MVDNNNQILFYDTQRALRKRLRLDTYTATLGDANGQVAENNRPGYVRVRYTTAAGLSLPPVVRMRANLPLSPGLAVIVGYDSQSELAVIEGDFTGMIMQGFNPMIGNSADTSIYGNISQSAIMTLLSHALTTADTPSTDVAVRAFIYVLDGTWHYFAGARVALAAYIPGADLQCLAGLYLDPADDTIDVFVSSDKNLLDPLGFDDIAEIQAQTTSGSLPVWFWQLKDEQTSITEEDSFLDARQFINTPGIDFTARYLAWRAL